MKYKLNKDIIIPSGTILIEAPAKIVYSSDHVEAIVDFVQGDSCASFFFDLRDAEEGLVSPYFLAEEGATIL